MVQFSDEQSVEFGGVSPCDVTVRNVGTILSPTFSSKEVIAIEHFQLVEEFWLVDIGIEAVKNDTTLTLSEPWLFVYIGQQ